MATENTLKKQLKDKYGNELFGPRSILVMQGEVNHLKRDTRELKRAKRGNTKGKRKRS